MGDPGAYTTKRGKDKMHKLGIRKDQQCNKERRAEKPKTISTTFLEKEELRQQLGLIGQTSNLRIDDVKSKMRKYNQIEDALLGNSPSSYTPTSPNKDVVHQIENVSKKKEQEENSDDEGKERPTCWNPTCRNKEHPALRLQACSSCHGAQYCGKECQVSHWSAHKADCKAAKAAAAAVAVPSN